MTKMYLECAIPTLRIWYYFCMKKNTVYFPKGYTAKHLQSQSDPLPLLDLWLAGDPLRGEPDLDLDLEREREPDLERGEPERDRPEGEPERERDLRKQQK